MKFLIILTALWTIHARVNSINVSGLKLLHSHKAETTHKLTKKSAIRNAISLQGNVESQDSIKLNTFTRLPDDVQGCACYFYLSKLDESKGKYIMAEIFAQIAYISINGKMLQFNLVDFKDKQFYIYSNGIYILKVVFKNKITGNDEDFRVKGTLTLYKSKKILIKRDIIGGCSC